MNTWKLCRNNEHLEFSHSFSRFIAGFTTSSSIICSMHVFDVLICYVVILCVSTNVFELIACRVDAYSERKSIFTDCWRLSDFNVHFFLYALIWEQYFVRFMSYVPQPMVLNYFCPGMIPIVWLPLYFQKKSGSAPKHSIQAKISNLNFFLVVICIHPL